MIPAKPTDLHILDGTYRPDRHSNRADGLYDDTAPEQIRGLGKDGLFCWELINRSVPKEILKHADTLELFVLCRWWSLWRKYDRQHAKDGDSASFAKAKQATEQWLKLSQRFGLSPYTRSRIMSENATGKTTDGDLRRKYLG